MAPNVFLVYFVFNILNINTMSNVHFFENMFTVLAIFVDGQNHGVVPFLSNWWQRLSTSRILNIFYAMWPFSAHKKLVCLISFILFRCIQRVYSLIHVKNRIFEILWQYFHNNSSFESCSCVIWKPLRDELSPPLPAPPSPSLSEPPPSSEPHTV